MSDETSAGNEEEADVLGMVLGLLLGVVGLMVGTTMSSHRWFSGWLVGFLVGGGAGSALGLGKGLEERRQGIRTIVQTLAVIGAVLGAIVGFYLGAPESVVFAEWTGNTNRAAMWRHLDSVGFPREQSGAVLVLGAACTPIGAAAGAVLGLAIGFVACPAPRKGKKAVAAETAGPEKGSAGKDGGDEGSTKPPAT